MIRMRTYATTFAFMMTSALAGTVLLAAPVVAAPDYVLDAAGIEQTVLRAQLPASLGSWHQNIYFSNPAAAPDLCYGATGTPLTLPKATTGGAVGYSITTQRNASISLYQYADQAAADAALAALKGTVCPDSTQVATDVNTVVKADQGSDFTDSTETGITSIVNYRYDGGAGMTSVVEIRSTTQRGLAVIQTEVILSGSATSTKTVNRAEEMNKRWHRKALAAYQAFGSGNSR
jgi:hypothetical protein